MSTTRLLSLCVLGAALLVHTPSVNGQKKHPAEEQGVARSIDSKVETTMEFVNQSQETIKVYWLTLEGKRDLRHTLKPGERQVQGTFLNHPWLITDDKDNAIGIYYPDFDKRVVTYGEPAPNPLLKKGRNPNPNPFGGIKGKGGGFGGALKPTLNVKFSYLDNADALAELKLTAEQSKKIKALEAKQKEAAANFVGAATARRNATTTLLQESDKEFADILDAKQQKRLDQIVRQDGLLPPFSSSVLRNALELAAEQQKKWDGVLAQYLDLQQEAAKTGAPGSPNYSKAIAAARKTTFEATLAFLTDGQKKVWQDRIGAPFQGSVQAPLAVARNPVPLPNPNPNPLGGFQLKTVSLRTTAFAFNNWDASNPRWLNEPTVRQALKMTDEQIKKLPASLTAFAVPKTLASDVLTPEQLKQYRGIYLQIIARSYGPTAAYRYKETLDALQLTDEQKTKIMTIAQEDAKTAQRIATSPPGEETIEKLDKTTEARLTEVLTPEQRMRMRDLLGEPFRASIQNPLGAATKGGFGAKKGAPVE